MTLLHRPQFGDLVRSRRRHDVPAGPAELDCIVIMGSNMAECHPVGFQWVMEPRSAARRSSTSIRASPARARWPTCTCRCARKRHRVPGRHRPLHPRERARVPRVRRPLHQRGQDRRARLPGHRGTRRFVLGLRPGHDGTTRRPGSTKSLDVTSAAAGAAQITRPRRSAGSHGARTAQRRAWTRRSSIRAACSRCSSATSRATRPRSSSTCAACPRAVRARRRNAVRRTSGRERTTAFCYAVGWTQHTVGVQYIRTAAIMQLLLGNIGRPGGGIMALRGTRRFRAPRTSRRCTTFCPATCRCRTQRAPDPRRVHRSERDADGYWGDIRHVHRQPAQGMVGRRRTADNDYCFDYLPRITGDHSHTRRRSA